MTHRRIARLGISKPLIAGSYAIAVAYTAIALSAQPQRTAAAFDLEEVTVTALARRMDSRAVVRCASGDGSLTILCEPVLDGPEAEITTPSGVFQGPDLVLTITDSWVGEPT